MKITCALSKEHLLKLAAVIYKDIEAYQTNNKAYDARVLMNQLYDKLKQAQGEEVALSYMQQMPFLVGQIAFKESTELTEDFAINDLFKLNKEFRNEEFGVQSLLNFFGKTVDASTLKLLADEELNNPVENETPPVAEEPPVEKFTDKRLKVLVDNTLSTTWEEFIEMDPNLKVDETIENVDPTKTTVYNTLDRLRKLASGGTALDTIVMDDNKVKLRVWSLSAFPQDLLYQKTKDLKQRINTFQSGKAKDQGEVKPVTEQFMVVLTNEKGQILYFNEAGVVTPKENGGKPVYQMLRDVRLEKGGEYRVTDIYGREDMILGASQTAQARMRQMGYKSIDVFEKAEGIKFSDFVNQIEEERQAKFKEYYNFRQSLIGIPANRQIFLPLVDVSNGVRNGRVIPGTMNINNLKSFTPEQAEDILESITLLDTDYVTEDRTLKANTSAVQINGEVFEVDRPDISTDLATKIAKVLTAKDLSITSKLDFVQQFLDNALDEDVRRHFIKYDAEQKKLRFLYRTYINAQFKEIKKADPKAQNTWLEVDLTGGPAAEAKIIEVLLKGKGTLKKENNKVVLNQSGIPEVGRYYPAKIKYDKGLLQDGTYFDYIEDPNKPGEYMFSVASYKTGLLPTMDAKIKLGKSKSIPLFNSYMIFAIPNAFSKSIDEIKEENEIKGEPSEIRKKYNELVDILKNSPDQNPNLKATVTKLGQLTQSTAGSYRSIDITIEGQEGTFRLYRVVDTTAKVGDTISLILRDIEVQDGMGYPNTIVGVRDFEGRKYDFGYLQESFRSKEYTEPSRQPVPLNTEPIEEIKQEEELDDITDIQSEAGESKDIPTTPIQPGKGSIGRILDEDPGFVLDRKTWLNQSGITQEQLNNAKDWWTNSSSGKLLNKYIELSVAGDLVNSDVYAKFIAKGAWLLGYADYKLQPGKLGVIALNPLNGGNYVDVYHEAWHVFSQLFLNNEQRVKLYTEFRNSDPAYKDMSFFEIEERLAENFREYARNPKAVKSQPVRNTLFRKILNFLKELFGKVSPKDIIDPNIMEIGMVKELFDALYFNNDNVLNRYSPSIDNLKWDELDRGVVAPTGEKNDKGKDIKVEVLNEQDGRALANTLDSVLSQIVDENFELTNKKSGTVKILTDTKNKQIAYDKIRKKFIKDVEKWQKELFIKDAKFDTYTTLDELDSNAFAVIKSKKGDHKYIFLRGQVESFANLTADTKLGEREKGKLYKDNIEIVADYFEHDLIKDDKGRGASILIVDSKQEAEDQFKNYTELDTVTQKQKAPSIESIKFNEDNAAARLFTPEQQLTLDNIRIYETALKHWDSIIAHHENNSTFDIIKQKYILLEEDPSANSALDATKAGEARTADKKVGEFTLQEMANKETVYILKSLFKKEKKGTGYVNVYDRFGNKQLADFRTVWNAVVRATNSAKDPQKIYDAIVNAAKFSPELQQLIDYKLPHPNQVKQSSSEFDITTAFFTDFSRPKIPYIQLLAFDDGTEFSTEVTDAGIDVSKTLKVFEAKFRSDKNDSFIEKDNNISRLNLNAILQNFKNSNSAKLILDEDKAFRFLTSMGFYFDDLKAIKDELKDFNNRKYYYVPRLFETIDLVYQASLDPNLSKEGRELVNKFRMNPLRVLRSGIPPNVLGQKDSSLYKNGLSQKTIIDRLLTLQSKYGKTGSNFSVLNPERNRVNLHTDDNTATVIADAINQISNKSDMWTKTQYRLLNSFNPAVNAFTNRSQIMKALFEPSNKRRSDRFLEIVMVAGTQLTLNDKFLSGTSTTSLDGQGKFLQDFHTFLKSGYLEFLRPGSKASSFGFILRGGFPIDVKGMGKNNEQYLYADINEFLNVNNKETEVIERIILPYLAGELERINKFKENPQAKNYIGYNQKVTDSGKMAGEEYAIFEGILNPDTKSELLEKINNSGIDLMNYLKNDPDLKSNLIKQIKRYFTTRSTEVYNRLNEGKYVDPKLYNKVPGDLTKSEKEKVLAKTFMYNYWIHGVETQILFLGDMSQYNHLKEELHKRTSGLISNGPRFRTDTAAQLFINNKDLWAANTYASTLSSEYQKFQYDGTFNTAIMEDISRDSVYLDVIKKGLEKDYAKRYALLPTAEAKKLLEERVAKEIAKYTADEIKEGDGQGYITVDAYRALKKLQNRWSDQQELLYQKVIKGSDITPAEYVELFPPYKLQYFGPLVAQTKDFANGTVLPVTAFHKFALVPLIPSWVKGSDLEVLHKEMLRNNIQYATFGSGSKVGSVTSNGKLDQIYEPGSDNKKLKSKINFTKNTIHVEYLKEVTSVPSKLKGKVIFSTQLRKLILEGLFIKGALVNGVNKDIVEGYTSLVDSYTKLLKEELLTEIGYTKTNGVYIGKPAKLLKLIKDNLAKKDYPSHLLDALKTNPDGSLRYDLSNFIDAQTIERTVLSIAENRFVKQKLKGEALVQVASSMTNGLWTAGSKFRAGSQEDILKYMGTNNLPFYYPGEDGKTNAMKVAIALQGDFFNLLNLTHIDGQPIKTRERLNEMIKEDEWLNKDNNRKAVTMTAVRIPVQGLNSMEFMEVWEFLDPSASNIIIPPTELVAKSGGDYDVDKLTTFMPNIDKDGNIYTSDKNAKALLDSINAADGKDKMALIKQAKKVMENELINSIRSILELPENYATLVRPNDTYMLKDIADELADVVVDYDKFQTVNRKLKEYRIVKGKKAISPTTTLEPLYNIDKFNGNMIGKAVLGIGANENAFSPLLNSIGAKMPLTYKESEFDPKINKYKDIKDGDTYKTRLLLRHSKNADGSISLAEVNSVDAVNKIADLFSQGMNGWVDVEKDQWIFYIQGNLEISPVLLYLLKAGVPVRDAIMFVSTPLIREYANKQRLLKSPYATLMGIAPAEPQYAQYEAAKEVLSPAIGEYLKRTLDNAVFSGYSFDTASIAYYGVGPNGRKQLMTQEFKGTDDKVIKDQINDFLQYVDSDDVMRINFYQQADRKQNNKVYSKPRVSNKEIYNSAVQLSDNNLNTFGDFDATKIEQLVKSKNSADKYSDFSMATFLHFIEIEKYLKGLGGVKRLSKPDVQTYKSIQEILLRDLNIEHLTNYSKVDKVTFDRLRNDSILSALADKEIITQVISPLFSLRNSKLVLDEILSTINTKPDALKERYGGIGADNVSRFIEEYKNAIGTFILQNFLSNNINSKGEIVLVPDTYKGFEVVTNENLETDVEVVEKDGKKIIRVNPKRIEADFKNKNYLVTSSSNNSYKSRGLEAFQVADDVFESKSSYYRYVIEREYLKDKGFTKEELNSVALLNTYNPSVILRRGTYSFTDQLLESIQQFPELSKYPVVNQLSLYAFSNEFNVLTLNDKDLLDGAQADIYAQNIRELANPKIQKIANTKDNEKVSRLFYMLQLMATYQHGSGPALDGFNEIIPQDSYLSVMNNASPLFTQHYFNKNTLEYIVDVLTKDKLRIKNYTGMPTTENTFVIEAKAEGTQPSTISSEELEIIERDRKYDLKRGSMLGSDGFWYDRSKEEINAFYDNQILNAKLSTQSSTQPKSVSNPKDYTNHSGGAYGGDTFWDIIGREFGVTKHMHYKDAGNANLSQKLKNAGVTATVLTKEQMDKARIEVENLLGKKYPDTLEGNLQVRNYYQVANADAVFAIAKLSSDKITVSGGTNTAVQLGIEMNKPTYVWDIVTEGWYKYNGDTFQVTETPTLTKNFAGVGSRDIENYNTKDKTTGKWTPRKEYLGTAKEAAAKQAIKDVYTQTFGTKQKSDDTTVKYQYYGAPYDIVVENGLGIDVLNYKGKPAKKAILLAYFNQNPNIDPQSTGPDPIIIRDEEKNEENLGNSDPTTGNTFKFADGSEVDTPFKLNKEQEAALLRLEEFYNDPKKFNNEITLIGYAGTGKTSIMSIFDKWLNKGWFGPNVVYTAPTHRANAVTKLKNPKIKVLTLHSLFGFGPEVDFEGMDYDVKDLQFANNRNGKIERGQILIVDESSMITDELYDYLGQQKDKYDLKIIFMGDPGQLGPVQNKGGLTSKVFSNPTSSITLTKVERTGDNPILKESTVLRSGGSLSYQSAEINGKGVEYVNSTARENQILAENLNEMRDSENYLYFRMLAATNPEVARLNKVAREVLYPETYKEQLVVGEILMGYDNFGRDYKTGQSLLYNSGDYMIAKLSKNTKEVFITNYEKQGDKFVDKGVEELKFNGYKVTLKNLLDPEAQPFEVFIPDVAGNDEASTKLADSIHKLNYMGKIATYGQDKARYFEKASNLSKQLLFMHDVKGLTDKAKIKKAIDYGYAHTIHKSQGGTYTKVFINDPSITGLVGYIKDRRRLSDTQAQTVERQLKYVAVSRATDYVYISTNRGAAGRPTNIDDPASGDFDTVGTFNINDLNPSSNPPISGERKPIEPMNAQEIEDGLILQKGVLTKEEQKQFFQFGKTVLEKNGYNPFPQYVMASAGKMEWSPEFVVDKNGKGIDRPGNYNTGIIQIKKNLGGRESQEKRWNYNYYLTNFDGTPIAPIPNSIINILEKVTGQDMSDYDTVLINLYPLGRTLGWHQDTTEDYRNMDRDIISVSIGADADFTYNKRDKLSYTPAPDSTPDGVINLKSGDVMSFGGKARLTQHTVTNVTGQTDLGSINLANSNVNKYFNGGLDLSNWRMNFTFRVADSKNNNGKRGLVSTVPQGVKKFQGQMKKVFGLNEKRAGIIANTAFDAIVNGERTATTRYEGEGNIEYWKKAKVGDIITWESADGRTVDVEVTKPLHKLVGSGKTPTDWSQLEGWSISYFNEKVKPKLTTAWQIEFKLPAPPAVETEINDNFIDPFEDDQENNCAYPF